MQMDQPYEPDLINGQVLDEVFYPYHLSHIELDHKDIFERDYNMNYLRLTI